MKRMINSNGNGYDVDRGKEIMVKELNFEDEDEYMDVDVESIDNKGNGDKEKKGKGKDETSDEEYKKTPFWVYSSSFFVVIASVLGTGILGLPVKLGQCGFTPFLVSYIFCVIMQIAILVYLVDLLQKSVVIRNLENDTIINPTSANYIPLPKISHNNSLLPESSGDECNDTIRNQIPKDSDGPSLHDIGKIFLGKYSSIIFDVSVMVHFVSIMVSYGLAGPEAYGQLFQIDYVNIITPFIVFFVIFVIFGTPILHSLISFMTFSKGILLLLMVILTGVVAFRVKGSINNDFLYFTKPFLIGTVALGGAANVIPIIFSKVRMNKEDMKKFVYSISLGLFVTALLTISWCYFTLVVVPQIAEEGEISLLRSEKEGEIATVPLIEIILTEFPRFKFVAMLVDIFILVSITVSFITVGFGMKHMIDGLAQSWSSASIDLGPRFYHLSKLLSAVSIYFDRLFLSLGNSRLIRSTCFNYLYTVGLLSYRKVLLYILFYSSVLFLAQLNPKGFLVILENVTSLVLNLEAGVFIVFMMMSANSSRLKHISIPLPINRYFYYFRYVVVFYFLTACSYDVILWATNILT